MGMLDTILSEEKPGWWRRWLVAPVIGQLTCGISPERLAWTIAAGMVLGVFPVMGTTTLICLFAGWAFRLNQPVLHVFRAVVYPLHLVLILVFIHLGEHLFNQPLLSFSIPELMGKFKESPLQFCRDFGIAAFHGVVAWMVVAPFAALLIKMAALPVLRQLRDTVLKRQEVTP
ncbi:MAG: DUF2062 domain-containing protein [Luteolibacter sp.]